MRKIIIPLFIILLLLSCNTNEAINTSNKDNTTQLKNSADSAYDKDDFLKSIYFYTKLINLDSTQGEYYFRRGYSFSRILNADQAIEDYLKAVELGYRQADAYKNIGINYSTLNDSLAIWYFQKSLALDPQNDKIKNYIKECYQRLKKESN
jgi:tetratricopeptide (TPR) repeat protein